MKDSLIINFLIIACARVVSVYKKSITYKILNGIYLAVSNAWRTSVIIDWFRSDAEVFEKSSLFSGLKRLFEFVPRSPRAMFEESVIKKCVYAFAYAVFAVNTRVISVLINSFVVAYAVMFIIFRHNGFVPVVIGLLIIGVILGLTPK